MRPFVALLFVASVAAALPVSTILARNNGTVVGGAGRAQATVLAPSPSQQVDRLVLQAQQAPQQVVQRPLKIRVTDDFDYTDLSVDLDTDKRSRPLEEQKPLPHYSREAFLHLVFEYPKVNKIARQAEFTKALQYNVDHPLIKTIHLFVQPDAKAYVRDNVKDPSKKLDFIDISAQMLYSDAFEFANKHLSGKIVIIMNADIEIGDGWDKVTEESYRSGGKPQAFALTRYQRSDCGTLSTFCFGDGGNREKGDYEPIRMSTGGTSHDSFSFLAPVPDAVVRKVHFKQNEWTAENHVISALRNAGVKVINPCLTLQTWHEHCSEFRTYSQVSRLPQINNGNERPAKLPGA